MRLVLKICEQQFLSVLTKGSFFPMPVAGRRGWEAPGAPFYQRIFPRSRRLVEWFGDRVSSVGGRTAMSVVRHSSGEIPVETEPVNEIERDILLLLRAENRDPFRLLGPHIVEEGEHRRLVVRGFFPGAEQVFVKLEDRSDAIPARRIRPEGLFEADLPLYPHLPLSPNIYHWRVLVAGRPAHEIRDPYAFAPLLSDFDLYLMGEGT